MNQNRLLVDFLGAMGIRLEQVNELVGDMSGGERVRVALVKALLQASDLLILDEPTNYLDIPALEALTAVSGDDETSRRFRLP